MLATIPSATVLGVDGQSVTVEVHVSAGLPGFKIVGLPDTSCREARDRVRAALLSSGSSWPQRRVTVNLAPSGVRKVGSATDVAIAIGLLVAAGELPPEPVARLGFIGELGLDGSIRAVPGTVSLVDALDADVAIVPTASRAEARVAARGEVRPVSTLQELLAALRGEAPWPDPTETPPPPAQAPAPDLADVRGQALARVALEIAAAGGHHLLMVGPPGAGKTMLARRLVGLLPRLDDDRAREVTRVWSAAGERLPPGGLVVQPPFRAPHHTASLVSLVGGGTSTMRPGEVSCAHCGVLFLDELGEFPLQVIESLRQPLEAGYIRVSRALASVVLPAQFLLVAAMNPCPCGEGQPQRCRCTRMERARYRRRLSSPLLDRFDLRVNVARPDVDELLGGTPGESTAAVAARVVDARERAAARGVTCNAELPGRELEQHTPLTCDAADELERVLRTGQLSARGLARIRRLALTMADLAGVPPPLTRPQVRMALHLRADPMPPLHEAVPA